MSAEQRVKELGLDLPSPPRSAGNYVAGVQVGNLLFLSGCGPQRAAVGMATLSGGMAVEIEMVVELKP